MIRVLNIRVFIIQGVPARVVFWVGQATVVVASICKNGFVVLCACEGMERDNTVSFSSCRLCATQQKFYTSQKTKAQVKAGKLINISCMWDMAKSYDVARPVS